jgi:hypothetical protein
MENEYPIKIKGKTYILKPSTRKKKKYDVFLDGKYLVSFGELPYQHYRDVIGHYSDLDHRDMKRRMLYRKRHMNDNIDDPTTAGFWAYNFLW